MPGQGRKRIEGELLPAIEGEAPATLEELDERAGRDAGDEVAAIEKAEDEEEDEDEDDEDEEDEDDEDEDEDDDEETPDEPDDR